tara:strand:+ start:1721 stop:1870 length:150 start_codon:yes stop_codon:yes gene_type:complete
MTSQLLVLLYLSIFIGFKIGAFLATRTKMTFPGLLIMCFLIKMIATSYA